MTYYSKEEIRSRCFRKDGKISRHICPEILTFNVTVIRNDRKVLNGKEIDIWIPEYNLGIEYNGIYWHSSDEAKKADHNKMILAESVGIKLLQFWCYEVDNEIDKVLEIISGNFV